MKAPFNRPLKVLFSLECFRFGFLFGGYSDLAFYYPPNKKVFPLSVITLTPARVSTNPGWGGVILNAGYYLPADFNRQTLTGRL
jgi:hypothetical protein